MSDKPSTATEAVLLTAVALVLAGFVFYMFTVIRWGMG